MNEVDLCSGIIKDELATESGLCHIMVAGATKTGKSMLLKALQRGSGFIVFDQTGPSEPIKTEVLELVDGIFPESQNRRWFADILLLVYDITNRSSFSAVFTFLSSLLPRCSSQPIIFLVGTHSDLSPERKVGLEEAQTACLKQRPELGYLEVGADGTNIDLACRLLEIRFRFRVMRLSKMNLQGRESQKPRKTKTQENRKYKQVKRKWRSKFKIQQKK
eukprot:gnl/Chilomastix_caulleri/2392.p1 GENE.gnl/Chilomastix_caulleri/2392~~gnl/Chilomastix_caulleri/2392.p1  ORF type:complete len:219 (-),score=10.79 gnl/Chilomastix_caulleri/2392:7-663(-)